MTGTSALGRQQLFWCYFTFKNKEIGGIIKGKETKGEVLGSLPLSHHTEHNCRILLRNASILGTGTGILSGKSKPFCSPSYIIAVARLYHHNKKLLVYKPLIVITIFRLTSLDLRIKCESYLAGRHCFAMHSDKGSDDFPA